MNQFKPDCLIVAPDINDPQSVTLFEELVTRGCNPYVLPLKQEGKEAAHNIYLSEDEIIYGEDLSSVKAVYIRCLSTDVPPSVPPQLTRMEFSSWQARYLKESLKQKVFSGLMNLLKKKGALIINPPSAYFHHNTKAQFFYRLAKAGFPVPYTFSTNSLEFFDKKKPENGLIIKAGYGVGGTRRLEKCMPPDKDELLYCPAVFQQEINGKTIRVHTAGNKVVLSLKIMADDIDSRTDTKGFEVVSLEREHELLITGANRLLDLHFSAWDVIVDDNNELYLLDCNPGPYIWWIGPFYSRMVLSNLAELMSVYIRNGQFEDVPAVKMAAGDNFTILNKHGDKVALLLSDLMNSWKSSLRLRN